MASFSAGTTFTDGVANDVTAAKLAALVNNATPTSGLIQDRTSESAIAADDTLLFGDFSDSNNLKRMTVANFNNVVTTGTGTAASPAIVPTGDSNTGIFFPAADTIAFSEGGAEAMRIDSSGNVGIGTTSPVAYGLEISKLAGSNSGLKITSGTQSSEIVVNSSAGLYVANNSTTLPTMFWTNGTERLRIDSSGNVGIGTTSPSAKLHVQGAGTTSAAYTNGDAVGQTLYLQDTGNLAGNGGQILFGASQGIFAGIKSSIVSGTGPAGNLIFQTRDTSGNVLDRMTVTREGLVGIGTTSPAAKLHISTSGSSSIDETIRLDNSSNTASNGNKITWRNAGQALECGFISGFRDGATTGFGVAIGTSPKFDTGGTAAVERLRIDSSGNVGIGTTSPADTNNFGRSLDIRSSTGAAAYFRDSDDASKYSVTGFFGADSNAYLGSWGASTGAVIYTSGTERLRINSSGGVTIAGLAGTGSRAVNASATGLLSAASDASLKEEVVGANIAGLNEILQIHPKMYRWKDDIANRGENASVELGFIANDVAPIIPSAAPLGNDGLYGFYDRSITAALVKAVQELKAENDSLKSRIEALEAK